MRHASGISSALSTAVQAAQWITASAPEAMIVFRTLIPAVARVGFNPPGKVELDYTKKHIMLLVTLLVIGAAAVTGYGIYSYNTTSLSGSYKYKMFSTK